MRYPPFGGYPRQRVSSKVVNWRTAQRLSTGLPCGQASCPSEQLKILRRVKIVSREKKGGGTQLSCVGVRNLTTYTSQNWKQGA